jgi:lipoate-protein ligase A
MDARLIFDEPARGSWNMAVDEALLRTATRAGTDHAGGVILRFYQWAEPTLSLGYFQSVQDVALHKPARHLPLVRRATGGGAIVHHREITYSFVHPIRDRFSDEPNCLVRRLHGAVISTIKRVFGVEASLCGETLPISPQPFLCFQRRSEADILLDRYKVAGSAQRRHQRVVLQHGSVLLAKSPHANMLPGLNDLSEMSPGCKEVADVLASQIAAVFQLRLVESRIEPAEASAATKIERERFANHEWTQRR